MKLSKAENTFSASSFLLLVWSIRFKKTKDLSPSTLKQYEEGLVIWNAMSEEEREEHMDRFNSLMSM